MRKALRQGETAFAIFLKSIDQGYIWTAKMEWNTETAQVNRIPKPASNLGMADNHSHSLRGSLDIGSTRKSGETLLVENQVLCSEEPSSS